MVLLATFACDANSNKASSLDGIMEAWTGISYSLLDIMRHTYPQDDPSPTTESEIYHLLSVNKET